MMLSAVAKPAQITGKVVSSDFGIGDPAVLIHYMTTTIYSNKPKAICQEIMSNARDAHREVGTPDLAIRVKVPNSLSPTWECQDYGPGMDPERIVKVFTQYCNTTKRGDNKQTGGFGIGGKTPFAYADSFTIRTIAKEGDGNVLRNYVAIKEGNASPRLIEVGEAEETQEHTGTIISVPINPNDFQHFTSYTFKVSQFWENRPVVDGTSQMAWEEYKWHYQGPNWKIGNSRSYYSETHACIDGIPYAMNNSEFSGIKDELSNILRQNLVLFFNVGELDVTLNRESLDYTDKTKEAIVARLKEIQGWLETEIGQAIANAKDLWEANMLYRKLNTVFRINSIAKNVLWNNIIVDGDNFSTTGVNVRSYKEKFGKLRLEREWGLHPEEDQVIVYDDLGMERTDIRRIRTLVDLHPDTKIFVVVPTMADMTPWKTAVHWDYIKDNFIMLSSVLPKKIQRSGGGGGARTYALTDCSQFFPSVHGGNFGTPTGIVDYKHGSGIYIPTVRNKVDDVNFSCYDVRAAFKSGLFTTEQVYKIPQRFVAKLGKGWIPYDVAIKAAFDAYWNTIPHVVAQLNQDTNTENSFHNVMNNSHYVTAFFRDNLQKINDGKVKTWYVESQKVLDTPKISQSQDMQTLIQRGSAARINIELKKGIDTLLAMKDAINKNVLDMLSNHLYNAYYHLDSDDAKPLVLNVLNFIVDQAEI